MESSSGRDVQQQEDEANELERVLTRLASINDDARLETVLNNLLPRLVERLEVLHPDNQPSSAKAKEVLINIFTHVLRWIKPPSSVKLPIEALARVIRTKLDKGAGMRIAMTLIEIGFDRADEVTRIQCVEILLEVHERLVGSQNRLLRFLFPSLVLRFDRTQLERHKKYFVDLAVDCCYPPGFFPPAHARSERLVGADRAAPSLEECAARAKTSLILLGKFTDWDSAASPDALTAGVLCSSTWPRDDVKSAGEDMVKRIRDHGALRIERELEIKAIYGLILSSNQRPKAPINARIKAMDVLPRLFPGSKTREGLVKVIVAGLLGADQPVQVRIQALKLIADTTDAFPAEDSPPEWFLSKALKQLVVGNVDHLTSDHRAALMDAFARWTSSRSPQLKITLCTSEVASRIVETMTREHELDAIEAEFRCLTIVGEFLENGAEEGLLALEPLIEAVEFGSSGSRLKSFALFLARRIVLSSTEERRPLPASVVYVIAMGCRPSEPKHQRDGHKRDLDRIKALPAELLPTFEALMAYVHWRERQWGAKEPPKEYFFPVFFEVASLPSLLSSAPAAGLHALWQNRALDAMLSGSDETKQVCVLATVALLNLQRMDWSTLDGLFKQRMTTLSAWTLKHLGTTNENLRQSCARMSRFDPSPAIADFVVERLGRSHGVDFEEMHGALCAAAAMAIATADAHSGRMLQSVASFVLDSPFKTHRPLRNEAFNALDSLSRCQLLKGHEALVSRLVDAAKDAFKDKIPEDSMDGAIAFIGSCASMEGTTAAKDAFEILMGLSGDSRFGIESQHTIGKSLSLLPPVQLGEVTRHILRNTVFVEASLKSRTSAAVLLEEIALNGSLGLFSGGDVDLVLEMVEGCLDMFGEAEELARMSACKTLFALSVSARKFEKLDALAQRLFRALEIRRGLGPIPEQAASERQPPQQDQQRQQNAAVPEPNAQRPRLEPAAPPPRPRRRGEDDRAWGFFDLALACQQSGISTMAFALFGIVGLAPHELELLAKAQTILLEDLQRAPSVPRLAVQFLRRRHLLQQEASFRAAEEVWKGRLRDERCFESPSTMEAVWTECARLLQDSFLSKERRSACLMLSEMAGKIPDESPFPCPVEAAWRIVYRALDDLDETIASGPALALGRGIKRRTLIGLRAASLSDGKSEEMAQVFTYLLEIGVAHPAKPARDLTRAFLVDAISQAKLPWRMACPVIEALLRTIGESELMALQYAQFHTRGGAGTGEIALDAHQLEEIRARLALDTPELKAAVKLATSLRPEQKDALGVAKDLVVTVARAVRTGVGLASLVAAVEMARFLSTEEWPCAAEVVSGEAGSNLLYALTQRFSSDPSYELKRRIAASAAGVARRVQFSASETFLDRYAQMIASEYEDDPEASVDKRKLAAIACMELVKRGITKLHVNLQRACYLGRFDPDATVALEWRNAFENGMSSLIDVDSMIRFVGEGVLSQVYRVRRAAAQTLLSGGWNSADLHSLAVSQQAQDLLRVACAGGAYWEGKDTLVRAVGGVFASCGNEDLSVFALNELLESTTRSLQQQQPKWLLEALFEAMTALLASLSGKIKAQFVARMLKDIPSFATLEPLVLSAALKALSKAVQESSLGDAVPEDIAALLSTILDATPTWNVRASAFEALAQILPFLHQGPTQAGLFKHLETSLKEEKKPLVLLPCLECVAAVRRCATRPSASSSPSYDAFMNAIHADLLRLEGNADVGVGRAAHNLLQSNT